MFRFYTRLSTLSRKPSAAIFRVASLSFVVLAAALVLGTTPGCGGKSPEAEQPSRYAEDPDKVLWPQEDQALVLELNASNDLNFFEDKPHTLLLCVYQLDKPDAFTALAAKENGTSRLLQCEAFDPSVKGTARIFLQPGENAVHSLARAEGARHVGIVGGYFAPSPVPTARVWEIPLKKQTTGWIMTTTTYSAGSLHMRLQLDAQGMRQKDTP